MTVFTQQTLSAHKWSGWSKTIAVCACAALIVMWLMGCASVTSPPSVNLPKNNAERSKPPDEAWLMRQPLSNEHAVIGRLIFTDRTLSDPHGQACISCHLPEHGFAEPLAVSRGAIPTRIGERNAMTLLYAALTPPPEQVPASPTLEPDESGQVGGLFHDGRAATLEDQARQPFFNPLEMNLANEKELAERLRTAAYAAQLQTITNQSVWQDDKRLIDVATHCLAQFMREPLFLPYDSPADRFIAGDRTALNAQQERGMNLFMSSRLQCNECHLFNGVVDHHPALTDYSFANLGQRLVDGKKLDRGLGAITGRDLEIARFKTPTLRNIAITAPYMHDGSLATLHDVMVFYNTRDIDSKRWGEFAHSENLHTRRIGDLRLSEDEINDIIAFMEALTDSAWKAAIPKTAKK